MVPPFSHRVSRVRWYFGSSLLLCASRTGFSPSPIDFPTSFCSRAACIMLSKTPKVFLPLVWPLPISLATTFGISFDFSSSPYLDVSVQAVPFLTLFDSDKDTWAFPMCVPTFGDPWINGYLHLPMAYRSLSRPSSAPDAKASVLRSF